MSYERHFLEVYASFGPLLRLAYNGKGDVASRRYSRLICNVLFNIRFRV
jgi:hypothetical protein